MRRIFEMLCLVLIAGSIGCNSSSEATPYQAALRQAATCDDVLQAIQEDAIAKVDLELKAFVEQDYYRWGTPVLGVGVEFDGSTGGAGGPPVPSAGADGANAPEAPSGYSDTNRQVADVDEADIAKVGDEGRKLYVIRGNGFYEFDSWPAEQTSKVADLEIEGSPIEMFVEGARALVFSNAYGVEALDNGDLCTGYPYGAPEPALADVAFSYYCGRSFVKLTVIDLSGDAPQAVREIYVDGWYNSSRRHGNIARAIVQSSMQRPASVPNLWDFVYGGDTYPPSRDAEILLARAWAAKAKDAIRATTLEQWVPVWGERIDGVIQPQPVQCADFYAPAPGLTNYGLTQIVGIDMSNDSPAQITSILGDVSQVYANGEALILAQPDWTWFERDTSSDRTAVHRFAVSVEGQRTPYQGSGFVPGIINDQFSIDERAGIIRLATTRTTWNYQPGDTVAADAWVPPTTDNLVTAMKLNGNALEVVGSTPPLAEGERIFSARFIGDLGYVVTFRQVDPLFAIDLSDPENPTVLGMLKIPGFSDYMHPLGDHHLLTIGRDIDEVTQVDNGIALQIFDVTDPVHPMLAHKAPVGAGYSEASYNHKAFNFYADRGLLAFPFVSYQGNFSSMLELWSVSVEKGLVRRGAVDHSDLVLNDCPGWSPGGVPFEADAMFYDNCGYQPEITRGVFIDKFLYSISYGGVRVHDVDDLTTPVATATY